MFQWEKRLFFCVQCADYLGSFSWKIHPKVIDPHFKKPFWGWGRDEFPRIKVFKVWKYGGGRGALQKHWSVRDRFWSRIHQRPISTPPYYTSPPPPSPPPPCKSVVWGFGGGVLQKPPICSSSTPGLQTYFHLGNYQIRQETRQMCQMGKVTKSSHSSISST